MPPHTMVTLTYDDPLIVRLLEQRIMEMRDGAAITRLGLRRATRQHEVDALHRIVAEYENRADEAQQALKTYQQEHGR